jgi:hypothetical protein
VRERHATPEQRASGVWALDRCSRPRRSPSRTPADVERRVCQARVSGPAGGRGCWPSRPGWRTRRSVRSSSVTAASRAARAAHGEVVGYEWPCPGDLLHIDVKRYPRFRRPGRAMTATVFTRCGAIRSATTTSTRRRSLAARLRRAVGRRARRDRHRLRAARACLVCRPRHHRPAADDRRRLGLHPQPHAARGAHAARHPAHRHARLHPTLERQGRALSPDHATRVGQWPALPQQHRQKPRPATLACAPQHAQPTQLTQRPTSHQPRSQPPRAGHLPRASVLVAVGRRFLRRHTSREPDDDTTGIESCASLSLVGRRC